MRIAVIHNLRPGGAARRLAGTLDVLGTRPGVAVRQFTMSSAVDLARLFAEPGRPYVRAPVPTVTVDYTPRADRTPRWRRPPARYRDLGRLDEAWRVLAGAVREWQPDVVFANPCGASLAAPAALRWLSAPSLLYCDEPRRVDYEPAARTLLNPRTRFVYGPLRAALRRGDRAAVAAATMLVTNSPYTAAELTRAYGRPAEVVAPGIAEVFTPAPAPLAPQHLLSVGALIGSKGHDLAVVAAGRANLGLPLVIVAASGNPAEEQRLRRLARLSTVDVSIRIGVSDEELVRLYRSAFATLYLARAEPLGLASLESQACGVPAVVADEGGLAETVREYITGLRTPREPEAVAQRLRVLAEGDRRARMCTACTYTPVPRAADAATGIAALLERLGGRTSAAVL